MTKIYNDYDQKILDLALEGLSYRKIADTLYFTKEGTIRDLINSLNNPLHENYNPDLYARILMEKSLHSNILVDKDLIDNVVRMILDGYLSIEIAILNNLNKDDYRRILSIIKDGTYYSEDFISKIKEKLRKTNRMNVNEKYKRIWRLEREYSFNAFEDYGIKLTAYKHWKSCFQLVEDFLYNGLDLSTLHLKYGFDRTTIKAILVGTDCSQFMANNFDAETCQKAKDKYFSIANASRENPYEAKVVDKFDDIKINKIINNKCFWILFMLTFRLSINDLAYMFSITDVKKLRSKILSCADNLGQKYSRGLLYLDVNSNRNNLGKAINFYKEYMAAKKNDPEKAQQMIKILDDSDYYELMKNRKSLRDMTIEERQIVAKYWVKYALEIRALPYERKSLDMFCMPCEEEEIKKIKEYNKENFRNYYVRSMKRDSYAKLGN